MTALFSLIILITVLLMVLSIVICSLINGISPMPSSRAARNKMIHLLQTITPEFQGDIYELGSGWGTVAFELAKTFPNHNVIAIENSLIPYYVSKLKHWISPRNKLHLKKADFYTSSIQHAGVIVCYLYPAAMQKLKEKFEKELSTPCWIVSNTFAIPGWKPVKTLRLNDLYCTPIYLYLI